MGLKFGYSEKEVGRCSLKKFMKIYLAYKNHFDLEQSLNITHQRYADLNPTIDDVIPM